MGQLGNQHKTIPIPWARLVFPLASFTLWLVRTNIEKCDMQFVTETFSPPFFLNNTVETVNLFEKEATTIQD